MTRLNDEGLAAIEAAAKAATPGQWRFEAYPRSWRLCLVANGDLTVFDTRRWGMNGAQLRFCSQGILRSAAECFVALPRRQHHEWVRAIEHPDARYIEAVSPETVLALIARLREAEQARDALFAEKLQ